MTDAKRGEHERHWRPYGIYCVCLNYQGFAVHGFDRFGRQLTSSDSNRYFTIECRNGVNVTKADKQGHQTQLLQSNSQVPLRVIVSGKPDFEDTVNWTRRVIPAILWVVFLATLLFSCYNLKVKTHLPVKFFSLAATTIALVCLAGWYACVLQPDENSTKASRF